MDKLVSYRCDSPDHASPAWANTVAAKASKVELTTTAKGGAQSVQTYAPVCRSCAKAAKSHAGTNCQNGEIAVEVSDPKHYA